MSLPVIFLCSPQKFLVSGLTRQDSKCIRSSYTFNVIRNTTVERYILEAETPDVLL